MRERYPLNNEAIPDSHVNFIKQGEGRPIILIHGLAASYHDWDALFPALTEHGFTSFALDLLGHGDSGKPTSRSYKLEWVFDHLVAWINSLHLTELPVLVGHSLGGYLALEYALRFPESARGLVLVNPFYRLGQLPTLLRASYRRPALNAAVVQHTPEWLFRLLVDATSLSMGHSTGGSHNLPANVRAQTSLDFARTAAGVYNLPNTLPDMTARLGAVRQPSMVIWGGRDSTLSPRSFEELVDRLPNVLISETIASGHVPHQSHPDEFASLMLKFLTRLEALGDSLEMDRQR